MTWYRWLAESLGMLAAISVTASGLCHGTPLGRVAARWASRERGGA